MTDSPKYEDHLEIWLEPYNTTSNREAGRLWCDDDVWEPEDYEGVESTRYVRADIFDWQPISTAPKDQTIIDVWTKIWGRIIDVRYVKTASDDEFFEALEDGPSCIKDATHWMKRPEEPR